LLTDEQIQERLPEGYTRIGPYTGSNKRMLVRCDRGHEYMVKLAEMMYFETRCRKCEHDKRRKPREEVQAQLQEGWTLIEYITVDKRMTVLCPSGHRQEVLLKTHRNGFGCTECDPSLHPKAFGVRRSLKLWTQERVDEYLEEEGSKYVREGEFAGRSKHVLLRCPQGHLMERITWAAFLDGKRCWQCFVERNRGETSHNYNHDMTPEQREKMRRNELDDAWRDTVYERDDYTCLACGQKGGRLNAHHLYNVADYPDSRRDVTNGVTLCRGCHAIGGEHYAFHRLCKFRKNTPEQFYQWLYYVKQYFALCDLAA
jgi:5-methylcytosine-specific restriction endonuclease McrA